MNKYFILVLLILFFFKEQCINAQNIDNHFFFLNNSLVNSDPVTYASGTVFLSGVDYNEGSNSGYPSYFGNFYSKNISMAPFCKTAKKTVYNFRQKTGLKYSNGSGSRFDDYTITVIIKFNTTPSRYFRVIDFSDGNSDNGIYNFQNNLNFYPNGNVKSNAFSPNDFTFLTLTRDGSTNTIDVYINDAKVSTYTDSAGLYKFPLSGNIIFARDNIPPSSSPNEDTNGQIAYIHVTNSKSSAAEVRGVYNNICSLIPPNISAVNDHEPDADGENGVIGVLNVFDNDTVDNKIIDPSTITLTETKSDPTGHLTLNPDGSVDLASNTPVGDYSLTYSICDNTYPSICDSATAMVSVLPIPQILTTADGFICDSGTAILSATASAGIINWYTSLTGGVSLGTGNTFSTPVVSNTTTYYVDATENWRVTKARVPVTLTVQNTLLPVGNITQVFCDIDNPIISDLKLTGTAIKWYAAAVGGVALDADKALVNGTYYASQTLNTCESAKRLGVNVTIYKTVVLPDIIPDLENCDSAVSGSDTDGITSFDLTSQETLLLNGQLASDFKFTYFEDAGHTIAIPTPSVFKNHAVNGQPIYVRIANVKNNTCYTDTSFNLVVHSLPQVNSVVELKQCDDDTDGISLFNLTEANSLMSTHYQNETITYYLTEAEAQSGFLQNQLTNDLNYPNKNQLTDTVFARVETVNGCFRTVRVNLVVGVSQIPASFKTLNYNECDNKLIDNDNTNGVATFDFSDADSKIQALFPGGITTTYYTSITDALAETNAIPDISNHRNETSPFVQNIYVRIDSDKVNACLGLGHHITLHVDPIPLTNRISDYIQCSDTTMADFDLTTKNSEVKGGQVQPVLISYHTSLSDAENNNAPVTILTNTEAKTVYIRVQFDDNKNGVGDVGECVNTDMSFNLVINQNPVVFTPDPIVLCNSQVNTVYDLTIRKDQITGGNSSIELRYFKNQSDINSNIPIIDPTQFNNSLLDNTVFVLATGTNMCTSVITMKLKTVIYDTLNETLTPIEECEIDNDGYDNFNLRRRETDILNGLNPADFFFFYYEQESDAISGNSNAIQTPGNFINTIKDTQTIYVNVKPKLNECFQVIPLTLKVNHAPPIEIEDEYVLCLSADNTIISPVSSTLLPNPPIDTKLNITEYAFQWYADKDGLAEHIIVGATDAVYVPTKAGDYTVIATDRLTGCTIPATTKVIGSYPLERILVELVSTAFSENNVLEVSVVGNGEYEYRLDSGSWQLSNTFERVNGGTHTVFTRDLYNCNEISEVKTVIDYPKYFTPNGDGQNDTWNIKGIHLQPNALIYIYDRYGKLLKQLKPKSPGWDGTFKGKLLPNSDYWFTVQYVEPKDDILRQFKAHFTLKR